MRDTASMAREAGMVYREFEDEFANANTDGVDLKTLKAFEALVRADEREETNRRANASWTLMCEKMVAAEREACAQLCEDQWQTAHDIQNAIRARGNT